MTTATLDTLQEFVAGASTAPADLLSSGRIDARVSQRLRELSALEAGWDGEDARTVDPSALVTAGQVIAQAIIAGLPEPELFPVPDGGVQVEWHAGPVELEVEIEPDQRGIVFVCDDEQAGQQIDGELPADQSRFSLAIARLAAHA